MKTIKIRRTRNAGHYCRSWDELINDVLLWTPSYGRAKAGRPARTYIPQLCADTGCSPEDLPEEMDDREGWWERVYIPERNREMDKRLHPPFSQERWPWNYLELPGKRWKFIMLRYSTTSNKKLRNFLERNKMVFGENHPQHHRFCQSVKWLEFVQKNLETILLLVDFSKAFDSLHWGKMEHIVSSKKLSQAYIYIYTNWIWY